MIRGLIFALAIFVATGMPTHADEKPALEPGNYFIYYSFAFAAPEQALCLIKVEKKGGELRAELLEKPEGLPIELKSFKVDGSKVDAVFDLGGRKLTFDGNVSAKNAKSAIGSFGDDQLLSRGKMVATEKQKLEGNDLSLKVEVPESMSKAQQLVRDAQRLRQQLLRTKDEEKRAELKKESEAADKEVAAKVPALFKEVLEKNADSPLAVEAVLGLLRIAEKCATPDEAVKWLKIVDAYAEPHGTRFYLDALAQCADALKTQKSFSSVTASIVDKAGKRMGPNTSVAVQVRFEKALLAAYEKDGKTDLAKQSKAKLDKLEVALDAEYLAKVPPFKPKAFAGRKNKSERVAVLELFTGAQCPPCVAADVAFDALQKSYKPTDLVLIQYHMHIPGPDPLTNPSDEARWKYYSEKFPMDIRGTPTVIFNGIPKRSGGGSMAGSEKKFKEYTEVIDPLLEEPTSLRIHGSVSPKGDKLAVKIVVDGIEEAKEQLKQRHSRKSPPKEDKEATEEAKSKDDKEANAELKLRLFLVEETIKYVGGNGLRFHHQVVRAMPGGAEGTTLKEKTVSKNVEIDLADIRHELTKYLDEYAKEREFSNPERPLALKHLRVIALVQDDSSREILQGLQLEVPESR